MTTDVGDDTDSVFEDKLSASNLSEKDNAIIEAYKNPYYRYLVLGILTVVYVSNFVDRQVINVLAQYIICLLYTSPSPRDGLLSRMPSSA